MLGALRLLIAPIMLTLRLILSFFVSSLCVDSPGVGPTFAAVVDFNADPGRYEDGGSVGLPPARS